MLSQPSPRSACASSACRRQAPVSVRIADGWRRGLIAAWVTTPGSGTWDCVITAAGRLSR